MFLCFRQFKYFRYSPLFLLFVSLIIFYSSGIRKIWLIISTVFLCGCHVRFVPCHVPCLCYCLWLIPGFLWKLYLVNESPLMSIRCSLIVFMLTFKTNPNDETKSVIIENFTLSKLSTRESFSTTENSDFSFSIVKPMNWQIYYCEGKEHFPFHMVTSDIPWYISWTKLANKSVHRFI